MRIWILAVSVLAMASCEATKKTSPTTPSSLPVITTFSATPSSGKAPLLVKFTMDVSGADHCDIVGIGNVACVGTKDWTVSVTTDFTLIATAANGKAVPQVTRVVIAP